VNPLFRAEALKEYLLTYLNSDSDAAKNCSNRNWKFLTSHMPKSEKAHYDKVKLLIIL